MIKNERQYKISLNAINRFSESISEALVMQKDVDPVVAEASILGMKEKLKELREQVYQYESLKS